MQNTLIKLFITVVAGGAIVLRIVKPDIRIDSTTAALLAMALLPWLARIIKRFKFLNLFDVELREEQTAGTATSTEDSPASPAVTPSSSPGTASSDSYLSRLLKYTPIELIVLFVLTDAILREVDLPLVLWVNFVAVLVLTPVTYWTAWEVRKRSQLIMMTVGFVAWALALGGPFDMLDWYRRLYGALALAAFTFVAPIFVAER